MGDRRRLGSSASCWISNLDCRSNTLGLVEGLLDSSAGFVVLESLDLGNHDFFFSEAASTTGSGFAGLISYSIESSKLVS